MNKLEKIMVVAGLVGESTVLAGIVTNNDYVISTGILLTTNLALLGVKDLVKGYKLRNQQESKNKPKLYLIK